MNQHSVLYITYLQSNEWRARCYRLYQKRGHVCEMCGRDDRPLEVHHKTYDNLGHERDDELLIVCREECHPKADKERAEREQRRIAQRGMRWATLAEVEELTLKLVARGE